MIQSVDCTNSGIYTIAFNEIKVSHNPCDFSAVTYHSILDFRDRILYEYIGWDTLGCSCTISQIFISRAD
jgi:hypothetical protein